MRHAAARRPFSKYAGASVMRIRFFLSACKAPAIILILSGPEGSYYNIYINSPGLLHCVHTGQSTTEKKSPQQLEGCQRGDVLSDGSTDAALIRSVFTSFKTNGKILSCLREHCTDVDLPLL